MNANFCRKDFEGSSNSCGRERKGGQGTVWKMLYVSFSVCFYYAADRIMYRKRSANVEERRQREGKEWRISGKECTAK